MENGQGVSSRKISFSCQNRRRIVYNSNLASGIATWSLSIRAKGRGVFFCIFHFWHLFGEYSVSIFPEFSFRARRTKWWIGRKMEQTYGSYGSDCSWRFIGRELETRPKESVGKNGKEELILDRANGNRNGLIIENESGIRSASQDENECNLRCTVGVFPWLVIVCLFREYNTWLFIGLCPIE